MLQGSHRPDRPRTRPVPGAIPREGRTDERRRAPRTLPRGEAPRPGTAYDKGVNATPSELFEAVERAFSALLGTVRRDPAVQRELADSVPLYFGTAVALDDPAAAELAARRHAEWFLLERHSPSLLGAPVERLLGPLREALAAGSSDGDPEALELALQGLLTSTTGCFEVEDIHAGDGAWLRDVTGLARYALHGPELSLRLAPGDLLVGRLHPVGGGLHCASPAAAVFRGPGLLQALERDLERLRTGPGATILRLGQAELERMFFGARAADATVAEDPEVALDEARRWLLEHGVTPAHVEALLDLLAAAPPAREALALGGGDALGAALDTLAFESDLDLEAARRVLLAAWRALDARSASERGGAGPAKGGTGAGAAEAPQARARAAGEGSELPDEARIRAVEEFTRNRAAGRDAASELAALRAALGLDGADDDTDDDEESPAPDFPGVVGAMVHELVWETGVTEGEDAARALAPLAHLANYGAHIGVFEELGGRELVRFASFWVLERGVLRDADAATSLIQALRRFGEWCREAHDHDVMEVLEPALAGLASSLPRVVEANRLCPRSRSADTETLEDLGEVFEVADDAAATLLGRDGEPSGLSLDPRLARLLARGDRLRGTVSGGVLQVLRVYPPEAAAAT